MKTQFTEALESRNLKAIRKIPKSDLHNHCLMGGKLRKMEKFYGQELKRFTDGEKGVHGINEWLREIYRPVLEREGSFRAAVDAAFLQARSDGVRVLEMSMDALISKLIRISPEEVVTILKDSHRSVAPEIDFRPGLGFARTLPLRTILGSFDPYLESGYFRSIDLYDIEDAQPLENFRELFRFARRNGMKCKAHAGEFGDAFSVREAVEILELDEVQHGIGAASSPEVMKWLSVNGILLNVCPASNIALKRVRSYKTHPIRILFDHGVKVTVNTDDVMLFHAGNSEQYLHLFKSGLFRAEELDVIRKTGLEVKGESTTFLHK